ncbi:MAG: VCBS repeat-containing protein [Acidobacteriota bacterium]
MRPAIVFAALLATCAAAQTSIPLPKGFRPTALASADFNGDGHADVAVAGLGRGEVIVFLGDGRGGLRATPAIAAGANPADIDATKAFIAIANHETDYVTLLSGNGKGGFTPRTLHLHSKPHPHAVAVGDFDRDGRPDLAVDSAGEKRIMLLFGRDGWRGPGTPIDLGTNPYWTISAADMDGDGNVDLVTPNAGKGTLSILLGDGRGHFAHAAASPFAAGPGPFSAAIGDVNGDKRPDIVIANYSGHAADTATDCLTWIRNDGGRRFTPFAQRVTTGDYSSRIAAGDIDGDGFADAVFANSNGATVTIVYGSRSGPRETASVKVMPHPHAVTIAGRSVIVATEDEDRLLVVRGR